MILAIEPENIGGDFAALRHFVMDPTSVVRPHFQVLAFLVPDRPEAGTIQPYHARVETFDPGFRFNGGEISRFPFGVVYASDIAQGYRPDLLTDITQWFWTFDLEQRTHATVSLRCRLTGVDSIVAGHCR